MRNIKEIRQRIRAAKNIQQITRAMKMVAAARLRRAQDRVIFARPYATKMRQFMGNLSRAGELPEHPLLVQREVRRVGLIIVTSDRGLCGSYNTNVIRLAYELANRLTAEGKEVDIIAVGKKGSQFFARRGFNVRETVEVPNTGATVADTQRVMRLAAGWFESGEVDAIRLIYARFVSPITQMPQDVGLLPIETPKDREGSADAHAPTIPAALQRNYVFEPDATGLLADLLPRYVFTLLFQSLLEGAASEHGARMTAMSSATDNAGKMIQELTLTANRARQAGITKEILEVVGGAEALRG